MNLKGKSIWKYGIWIWMIYFPSGGFSNPRYYVTLSTIKARTVAMGGALSAVSGELSSLDGNPACFSLGELGQKGMSIFVNPVAPFLLLKNREAFSKNRELAYSLFRGLGIQWERIYLGFLIGEECLSDSSRLYRSLPWDVGEEVAHWHSTLGVAFFLSQKVSFGVAGEWLSKKGENPFSMGYRYGIQLQVRPNLMIGMFYFDFPDAYRQDRIWVERLADETLNAGVVYLLSSWIKLAMDIRNVTEEGKIAIREPHIGIEITPWETLVFRSGYYRNRNFRSNAFSGGFGIRYSSKIQFEFSFVQEERDRQKATWIFLTSLWRLNFFRKIQQEE